MHSITEDFVTGISILGRGYRSIAVAKELAHGLSPEDVYSFIKQRQRWSRGAAQGITNKKFWHSGLPLKAKWNFLISYFYWWTFVRRFIFILAPILYGIFGIQVADVSFTQLVAVWLPYYIIYNIGLRVMAGGTTNALWSDIIDTIQFPYMITPIIAGTLMIPQHKFFVTPKDRQSGRNSNIKLATPHIILTVLSLITAAVCIYHIVAFQQQGAIVVLFWTLYNLFALINAIVYYFGRENVRYYERIPAPLDITLTSDGRVIEGTTMDVSEGGMAVVLPDPEYLPIDRDIEVSTSFKEYRTTMRARVAQVAQTNDNQWRYGLVISEISEKDRGEYLQILYDRDHFFPRTVDLGIVKDLKNVYKGLTAKSKSEAYRRPRISMYARLHSPDVGDVYALNFNYKYILLHAKRALPASLRVELSDEIEITCTREESLTSATQGKTQLYQITDWEQWAVQPAFRARVFALASGSVQAQKDPEVAEFSEIKQRERDVRKTRLRRGGIVLAAVAVGVALYIPMAIRSANEVAKTAGISVDEMVHLYDKANADISDGNYADAIQSLSGIREFRDAESKYNTTVERYSEQVLAQAQTYQLSGQYDDAIALLSDAEDLIGENALMEAKTANVRRKYIDETFAQADTLVAEGEYGAALVALNTLNMDLGQDDKTVSAKLTSVNAAYREHYLLLARNAYGEGQFSRAIALLDEAQLRTGTSASLRSYRAEISQAYKDDYMARANVSITSDAPFFDDAIAILQQATVLFPEDDTFADKLLTVRVTRAVAEANALSKSGQYAQALQHIDGAIDTLGEMRALTACKAGIESAFLTGILQRANTFTQGGDYDDAITLLQSAKRVMPGTPVIGQKLYTIQVAQVCALATAQAAGGRYAQALHTVSTATDTLGQSQALLACRAGIETAYQTDILRRVDALSADHMFDRAISLLRDTMAQQPHQIAIERKLVSVVEQRQYQTMVANASVRAKAQSDRGNHSQALTYIDTAIDMFGQAEALITCRASIETAYREDVFRKADTLVASRQYDTAIAVLEDAASALPEQAEIQEKLNSVQVAQTCAQAIAKASHGQYGEALRDLEDALDRLGGAKALLACITSIHNAYQADVLRRADALMENNEYSRALVMLQNAADALSDQAAIAQKLREVRQASGLPARLGTIAAGLSWLAEQLDAVSAPKGAWNKAATNAE